HPRLTMKSTCSACPVADVICRTIELGLTIEGALVSEDDITVIQARPVEAVPFCPTCGAEGVLRDHVTRELTDLPVASHPARLHVRLPRYRCPGEQCSQVIFQHRLECAEVGAKTTNRCTRWILQRLAIDKMSVKAVADELGLGWDLVNRLALTRIRSLVYDNPAHLEGVKVLGVDEHCWSHVRGKGKETYATILVDLTPVIEGTGPSRLLDMRPGRSKKVLATWLKERTPAFRDNIEVARHGRLRRVPLRHRSRATRRCSGDGPLPRRAPRWGETDPVPPAVAATDHRSPRQEGRPVVQGEKDTADSSGVAHRAAAPEGNEPVGPPRRPCGTSGYVSGLSGHHRCLHPPETSDGQETH